MLALVNDTEMPMTEHPLDSVVLLEVGKHTECGDNRIKIDKKFFVGGVQFRGGTIMSESDGKDLCYKQRVYFCDYVGRVFLLQQ